MEIGIKYRRLSELREWEANPKLHDLERLVASFQEYSFTQPLLVNQATGMILSGHGRYQALRAKQRAGEDPPEGILVDEDGEWLVPVLDGVSLEESKAEAYAVDDNLSTMAGGDLGFEDMVKAFDRGKLRAVLEELAAAEELPVFAYSAGVGRFSARA